MGRVNPAVFKGEGSKQLLSTLYQINEFLSCVNRIICLEDEGMLQQECKILGEKTSEDNKRRGALVSLKLLSENPLQCGAICVLQNHCCFTQSKVQLKKTLQALLFQFKLHLYPQLRMWHHYIGGGKMQFLKAVWRMTNWTV